MKKVLCLVLVLILALPSTVFAIRLRDYQGPVEYRKARDLSNKNDVVYIDYSNLTPGDATGLDQAPENATIIKTIGVDGNLQSALCITDDLSNGIEGYKAIKNFPAVSSGYLKFEIRFKQEKLTSDEPFGCSFYLRSGNNFVNRLILEEEKDGAMFILYGTGNWWAPMLDRERIQKDMWYTFTALVNLDEMYLNASIIKHDPVEPVMYIYDSQFGFPSNFTKGTPIDNILLETEASDGKLIIDYIKVEKNSQELELPKIKRDPLPVPTVATPEPGPVKGITNIKYNGEYMYSQVPPIMVGKEIYVPVRSAIRALGFKVSYEKGTFTGTKGDLVLKLKRGSADVTYNGKTHKLSKALEDKNTALISLTELANIVGATAFYDVASNEYIITKEEAVK